jgi:phosphoribosyl 1,2-cyclic phosphodiesterase
MFFFCPLASGSSGNCLFFQSEKSKILIDAGINFRELEKRLKEINIGIDEIDAILVTHEHRDHVEGIKTIFKVKKIPIFSNSETAKKIYGDLEISLKFKVFATDEIFEFKDLKILPFSVQHDTLEPVGFVVMAGNFKIGICSDLGFVTSLVRKNLEGCDLIYVEANHDEKMLLNSKRPDILKRRIMGRQGHLSNEQCADLIESVLHEGLRYVYLSHLSSECNCREKALSVVGEVLKRGRSSAKVRIAYQDRVSEGVYF